MVIFHGKMLVHQRVNPYWHPLSQLTETLQVDELESVAQTGAADVPSLNGLPSGKLT